MPSSPAKPTVASPCISVCSLDEDTGFCRGCYRTDAEVEGWLKFSEEQKAAILEQLKARKQQHPDLGAR